MRRALTLILFLLALFILGGVVLSVRENRQLRLSFGTPKIESPKAQKPLTDISASVVASVTATSVLEEPRYTGRDNAGRMWEVTAAYATQSTTVSGSTMLLTTVTASLTDPTANQSLALSAPQGHFNTASETLTLTGGVTGRLIQ